MNIASLNHYERFSAFLLFSFLLLVPAYLCIQKLPLLQQDHKLELIHSPHTMLPLSMNSGAMTPVDQALARAQQALSAAAPATVVTKPVNTAIKSAWNIGGVATQPAMVLPEAVQIYQPVELTADDQPYPAAGQQLAMTLPDGNNLVVNIESSTTNPNGDYTWRGHLQGHNADYPVVMTYGGNSVFASIMTPAGSYTLESVNGSGWIYKNPSEYELSNAGAHDYLEIPAAQ